MKLSSWSCWIRLFEKDLENVEEIYTLYNEVELDALAFEYQGNYGTAFRNLDVSDVVNNPTTECKVCILSLSLPEESGDLLPS